MSFQMPDAQDAPLSNPTSLPDSAVDGAQPIHPTFLLIDTSDWPLQAIQRTLLALADL